MARPRERRVHSGPAIPARNERQEGSRGAGGTETSGEGGTRRPQPRAVARRTPRGSGPAPTLRIVETRILRGPNYWAREPVVRMLVDLGVLEDSPATRSRASPTPSSTSCPASRTTPAASAGAAASSPGSREGTWAGHIAEHIALELQNLAGTDVRHGKTRSTGEHGRYNVIYEFREESVGIEAGKIAVALVNHLVAPDRPRRPASTSWPSSSG